MLRLVLLLLALLVFRDASLAQSDSVKKCAFEAKANAPDQAIDDCSAAIQSGELSDHELAIAFYNRGFAFYNERDYDSAIRDYDRAINLQPKYAPALVRRALAHQEKRQYEGALADYEAAAQIDPKFAFERSKGFLFFYLGRMTQSAEIFEKTIKSNPDDTWVMLFRYLVEAKIGNAQAAARDLEGDAARLEARRWPAPIIDFHLGRIDEKAMLAAANDPDPKIENEKVCAANFHAGESRLFRGQVTAAIPLLRAAAKDCPSNFYESHGASTELKRLGQ
ncbi:MAG TPA: tetratricopeptide repeat protein [Terriglobales bacterium]|nr:tetratricopeptide repeat protein [Terriglobales bacterium]